MSFRTLPQTGATTTLFFIHALLASIVADIKLLTTKASKGRRLGRLNLSLTHLHPFPSKSSSRTPSPYPYPYPETDSDDDKSSTMGVKSMHSVSHSVMDSVKRKAGRLVCISNAGHSPDTPTFSAFTLPSDFSISDLETIESASSSSGSDGAIGIQNDSVARPQASKGPLQIPATMEQVPNPLRVVNAGPIITVEKLQRALSDSSDVEFQSSFEPKDIVAAPGLVLKAPKPKAASAKGLSILAPEPQRDDGDKTPPRTLSPPPDHFRRGVLANASRPSSPYTSPLKSPPASPMAQKPQGKLGLHEILSTEDLVAPRRLQLYSPGPEELQEGCAPPLKRIMSS